MNKVKELFDGISDEELRLSIAEIKEGQVTGWIKEGGVVRKYAKLSGEITGGFTTTDFLMSQVSLLTVAAFRWADINRFLILSGEGEWAAENEFVMDCVTLEEANKSFDEFKKGTYKNNELFIYEGRKIREE
jgi:hypothetical protein